MTVKHLSRSMQLLESARVIHRVQRNEPWTVALAGSANPSRRPTVTVMQTEQHLQRAIQIAAEAHKGQQDKLGNPYFDHCRRVADLVVGHEERIIAFLHDVPEKGSGWTLDRLKQEGFSPSVIAAVDALTKRVGEADDAFVRRAASNPLARPVKLADLEDNRVQAEQAGLDASKYLNGLEQLQNM